MNSRNCWSGGNGAISGAKMATMMQRDEHAEADDGPLVHGEIVPELAQPGEAGGGGVLGGDFSAHHCTRMRGLMTA